MTWLLVATPISDSLVDLGGGSGGRRSGTVVVVVVLLIKEGRGVIVTPNLASSDYYKHINEYIKKKKLFSMTSS